MVPKRVFVPISEAAEQGGLSRQRICKLAQEGRVRRRLDTAQPRWLYHLGDVLKHRATARDGRPRKD